MSSKAFERAQYGLQNNEEMTFTSREIDLLLPEELHLSTKGSDDHEDHRVLRRIVPGVSWLPCRCRWSCATIPDVTDFVGRAHSFVAANYPQAVAAFLGCGAASEEATESSDLDILIVLPDEWASFSFVETTTFECQLVEAFVYGRVGLRSWLEKGRRKGRPVLDRLIAHGVTLIGVRSQRDWLRRRGVLLTQVPYPSIRKN